MSYSIDLQILAEAYEAMHRRTPFFRVTGPTPKGFKPLMTIQSDDMEDISAELHDLYDDLKVPIYFIKYNRNCSFFTLNEVNKHIDLLNADYRKFAKALDEYQRTPSMQSGTNKAVEIIQQRKELLDSAEEFLKNIQNGSWAKSVEI